MGNISFGLWLLLDNKWKELVGKQPTIRDHALRQFKHRYGSHGQFVDDKTSWPTILNTIFHSYVKISKQYAPNWHNNGYHLDSFGGSEPTELRSAFSNQNDITLKYLEREGGNKQIQTHLRYLKIMSQNKMGVPQLCAEKTRESCETLIGAVGG